jgi:coenzyme F420-0:L-glutamate ligase/coenzyme F420-1:gamma-L-glutamate ligase
MKLEVEALPRLPEIRPGDDLAGLLAEAVPPNIRPGDVVCVAHKAVSKAEGQLRRLDDIEPGERANALAAENGKDPRLVQAVLDESAELLRAEGGVLIARTRHGLVCANAGVDQSNAERGEVVLLPKDPNASARALRAALPHRPAVVITDSFGRAWRLGQTDVAVGCAGLVPLDDWRGRHDHRGYELRATAIAVADAVAAAADLVRAKDSNHAAVLVTGLDRFVTPEDGPGASALRRPPGEDLFT